MCLDCVSQKVSIQIWSNFLYCSVGGTCSARLNRFKAVSVLSKLS